MADYLIQPEADHTADPNDMTNAIFRFGVADPGSVSGLTNGTAYVAREMLLSPASAAFTPTAVVATISSIVGAAPGDAIYVETDDVSTMYQDTLGGTTTPVAADGDPIGTFQRTAGTADMIVSNVASRPTWVQANGLFSLDDTANAVRAPIEFTTRTANMYVAFVARFTGDTACQNFALLGGSSSGYVGLAQDGNGSAFIDSAGSPTIRVNNVSQSWADRNDVHDALNGDTNKKIIEVIGADLSGANWAQLYIGNLGFSAFGNDGQYGDIVAMQTPSVADQTVIRDELAAKHGITL